MILIWQDIVNQRERRQANSVIWQANSEQNVLLQLCWKGKGDEPIYTNQGLEAESKWEWYYCTESRALYKAQDTETKVDGTRGKERRDHRAFCSLVCFSFGLTLLRMLFISCGSQHERLGSAPEISHMSNTDLSKERIWDGLAPEQLSISYTVQIIIRQRRWLIAKILIWWLF